MIRAVDKWLAGYLASVWKRPRVKAGPRHLLFCVADHFEPFGYGASSETALAVVRRWMDNYPRRFANFRDADGQPPRHTFFYPAEEYHTTCINGLAEMCRAGLGEVEVHLHHRQDTAAGFTQKLVEFRDVLRRVHGLLGSDAGGAPRYGFVHGNWALCNSRPDGDWCGVNEELSILRQTGCFADFTFPSAPSPTQPRMVNAIYYARDKPAAPRGHDRGIEARVGVTQAAADALLLVQGPLALDWRRRKWGVLPRLENAELAGANPATPARADLWQAQHIHVRGRPDWIFIKVHTHGCVGVNADALLGESMVSLHRHLTSRYNDGREWQLHYVTAREVVNIIHAAENGHTGDPGVWRDVGIAAPPIQEF